MQLFRVKKCGCIQTLVLYMPWMFSPLVLYTLWMFLPNTQQSLGHHPSMKGKQNNTRLHVPAYIQSWMFLPLVLYTPWMFLPNTQQILRSHPSLMKGKQKKQASMSLNLPNSNVSISEVCQVSEPPTFPRNPDCDLFLVPSHCSDTVVILYNIHLYIFLQLFSFHQFYYFSISPVSLSFIYKHRRDSNSSSSGSFASFMKRRNFQADNLNILALPMKQRGQVQILGDPDIVADAHEQNQALS